MAHIDRNKVLEQVKNVADARSLLKYLVRTEKELVDDQIGELEELLGSGHQIRHNGLMTSSKENTITHKNRFRYKTEEGNTTISPKNLYEFTLPAGSEANAPAFTLKWELLSEIRQLQGDLRREYKTKVSLFKQPFSYGMRQLRGLRKIGSFVRDNRTINTEIFTDNLELPQIITRENDFGVEEYIRTAFENNKAADQLGYGSFSRLMKQRYSNEVYRQGKAAIAGLLIAGTLYALLMGALPKTGSGVPNTNPRRGSHGRAVPGEFTPDGERRWDPSADGKMPSETGENNPSQKDGSQDFKELQKNIGSGADGTLEEMNKRVKEAYWKLTKDIPVEANLPLPTTGEVPLVYPKPRLVLPPYSLSDEATETDKPQIASNLGEILILYDVSGSHGDPSEILSDPENKIHGGYLLMTQLYRMASNMGFTMGNGNHPLDKVSADRIYRDNSLEVMLTKVLYHRGSTNDNNTAMKNLFMLYITKYNNNDLGPTLVVPIVDDDITYTSFADCVNLALENRKEDQPDGTTKFKDTLVWVNTIPHMRTRNAHNEVQARGKEGLEVVNLAPSDSPYIKKSDVHRIHAEAKKIMEMYTK
tara:strand:+ start:10117 stop:11883 length:1767 start_codon:yes stop_codon:yes gene_type:complete